MTFLSESDKRRPPKTPSSTKRCLLTLSSHSGGGGGTFRQRGGAPPTAGGKDNVIRQGSSRSHLKGIPTCGGPTHEARSPVARCAQAEGSVCTPDGERSWGNGYVGRGSRRAHLYGIGTRSCVHRCTHTNAARNTHRARWEGCPKRTALHCAGTAGTFVAES